MRDPWKNPSGNKLSNAIFFRILFMPPWGGHFKGSGYFKKLDPLPGWMLSSMEVCALQTHEYTEQQGIRVLMWGLCPLDTSIFYPQFKSHKLHLVKLQRGKEPYRTWRVLGSEVNGSYRLINAQPSLDLTFHPLRLTQGFDPRKDCPHTGIFQRLSWFGYSGEKFLFAAWAPGNPQPWSFY